MCRKLIVLVSLSLLLILGNNAMAQLDPTSVTDGHVYLFEDIGADVPDDSANTHTGNLLGDPQVVPGLKGSALELTELMTAFMFRIPPLLTSPVAPGLIAPLWQCLAARM